MANNNSKSTKKNNKTLWSVVSIGIAVLCVWVVISNCKSFSFKHFIHDIKGANIFWLVLAFTGAIGFVVFEGCAISCACKAFGYPPKRGRGLFYSAADVYFSAITPSATGGQPASAIFMMRDKIPGIVATCSLILNLMMYSASIFIIGILCFILRPKVFFSFNMFNRVLIVLGFLVQATLVFFFFTLIKNEKLMHKICDTALKIGAKLHIIRHIDKKREKLDGMMMDYRQYSEMLSGKRNTIIKVLIFNLLQRVFQIAVTMLIYLALRNPARVAPDIFVMQGFVVLGTNTIPIPGAMGISDYLIIDGLMGFVGGQHALAISIDLVSRTVYFYGCTILCALLTLGYYIAQKRRDKDNDWIL